MERLVNDLRVALRGLRRTPMFPTAVLLILALGIGSATAMFTVFKTVLIDRLPITAQDRVVIMHPLDRGGRNLDVPQGYLLEIARDSALIRGVAGVYHLMVPQPLLDGTAVRVLTLAYTSTNYFDVLGMRPVLGRFLRPEDGRRGAPPVIVLSYSAWRREFGGDPSVMGNSLVIPYTQQRARIVGVAPAGFQYPSGADVWSVIPPESNEAQVDIVARLTTKATIRMAREGLFALTQRVNPFGSIPRLAKQSVNWKVYGVTAQPFADVVV